jgi:hypothetical protein
MTRLNPSDGGKIRRHHCSYCELRWWSYQLPSPPIQAIPDWVIDWVAREPSINQESLKTHLSSIKKNQSHG